MPWIQQHMFLKLKGILQPSKGTEPVLSLIPTLYVTELFPLLRSTYTWALLGKWSLWLSCSRLHMPSNS
jgi:hypothetical protein